MSTVGRTTRISIPELDVVDEIAKVDTGAWSSSLHAEEIRIDLRDGIEILSFFPIDKMHPRFETADFEIKTVKSSFGEVEPRYCLYLTVNRHNKTERTLFNITNRSTQRSQILLGRLFLKKFELLVDVKKRARSEKKQRKA